MVADPQSKALLTNPPNPASTPRLVNQDLMNQTQKLYDEFSKPINYNSMVEVSVETCRLSFLRAKALAPATNSMRSRAVRHFHGEKKGIMERVLPKFSSVTQAKIRPEFDKRFPAVPETFQGYKDRFERELSYLESADWSTEPSLMESEISNKYQGFINQEAGRTICPRVFSNEQLQYCGIVCGRLKSDYS